MASTLHKYNNRQANSNGRRGIKRKKEKDTYSTYLFQGGLSDWAMNPQLVKIVHIINILNNVNL